MSLFEGKIIDGRYLSKQELVKRMKKMGVNFNEHILFSKLDYAAVYNNYIKQPKFQNKIIEFLQDDHINSDLKSMKSRQSAKSGLENLLNSGFPEFTSLGRKRAKLVGLLDELPMTRSGLAYEGEVKHRESEVFKDIKDVRIGSEGKGRKVKFSHKEVDVDKDNKAHKNLSVTKDVKISRESKGVKETKPRGRKSKDSNSEIDLIGDGSLFQDSVKRERSHSKPKVISTEHRKESTMSKASKASKTSDNDKEEEVRNDDVIKSTDRKMTKDKKIYNLLFESNPRNSLLTSDKAVNKEPVTTGVLMNQYYLRNPITHTPVEPQPSVYKQILSNNFSNNFTTSTSLIKERENVPHHHSSALGTYGTKYFNSSGLHQSNSGVTQNEHDHTDKKHTKFQEISDTKIVHDLNQHPHITQSNNLISATTVVERKGVKRLSNKFGMITRSHDHNEPLGHSGIISLPELSETKRNNANILIGKGLRKRSGAADAVREKRLIKNKFDDSKHHELVPEKESLEPVKRLKPRNLSMLRFVKNLTRGSKGILNKMRQQSIPVTRSQANYDSSAVNSVITDITQPPKHSPHKKHLLNFVKSVAKSGKKFINKINQTREKSEEKPKERSKEKSNEKPPAVTQKVEKEVIHAENFHKNETKKNKLVLVNRANSKPFDDNLEVQKSDKKIEIAPVDSKIEEVPIIETPTQLNTIKIKETKETKESITPPIQVEPANVIINSIVEQIPENQQEKIQITENIQKSSQQELELPQLQELNTPIEHDELKYNLQKNNHQNDHSNHYRTHNTPLSSSKKKRIKLHNPSKPRIHPEHSQAINSQQINVICNVNNSKGANEFTLGKPRVNHVFTKAAIPNTNNSLKKEFPTRHLDMSEVKKPVFSVTATKNQSNSMNIETYTVENNRDTGRKQVCEDSGNYVGEMSSLYSRAGISTIKPEENPFKSFVSTDLNQGISTNAFNINNSVENSNLNNTNASNLPIRKNYSSGKLDQPVNSFNNSSNIGNYNQYNSFSNLNIQNQNQQSLQKVNILQNSNYQNYQNYQNYTPQTNQNIQTTKFQGSSTTSPKPTTFQDNHQFPLSYCYILQNYFQ